MVNGHYKYTSEFYINFFEVCDTLARENGRIGMLVPRTFLFKSRFQDFREDFVGPEGSFDFLAEYGLGVLDNATVRTVGTVVRSGRHQQSTGTFIRLHDVATNQKEKEFLNTVHAGSDQKTQRLFNIDLSEFEKIPRTPICYSTPSAVRELHQNDVKVDSDPADIDADSISDALAGLQTSNDDRFARFYWEATDFDRYKPIAKGGAAAWILPKITETVEWQRDGTLLKRSSKSIRTRNEERYGEEGLTWTRVKETGRRFGYYPSDGLFSHTGFLLIPNQSELIWKLMASLNSNLYHALFLSLTVERDWLAGEVGSVPWLTELEEEDEIDELAKKQYEISIQNNVTDPTSPYYRGPQLLPNKDKTGFFYQHPHNEKIGSISLDSQVASKHSIEEAATETRKNALRRQNRLESLQDRINEKIYDTVGISDDIVDRIQQEIFLRTSVDPEDRQIPDPDSVTDKPEDLAEQVKDLVHHFALESIRGVEDGIIPLWGTDEQADMLDQIINRFSETYGEYADDRLVEVDDVLGTESASDEAYPNLRAFIKDELFNYHVDTMESTPIFWKLSTERLLADAKGEGFACFVDYHQLDASLFDRLSNQYLEPRKAELRERRSAANQRQNNESLSTTERAEATEEFEFCSNALEQIAELEEVMQELESTDGREFSEEDRDLVKELAPKVATFREETTERIDTLAELRERNGEEWFQDTFSDNFWSAVDEWREEWLDALDELECACEEYAKPSDEPVESHLADLFDYFNWRLKGSDHYSSTGILFMTYYFEREGSKLLNDEGEPFNNFTEEEEMLASLAMGVDDASVLDEEYLQQIADEEDIDDVDDLPPLAEFKALAEEIDDRCQTVYKQISSDWSERALSEITTAGYQPNQVHGVGINITPLAEKNIVPEIVEDKVL